MLSLYKACIDEEGPGTRATETDIEIPNTATVPLFIYVYASVCIYIFVFFCICCILYFCVVIIHIMFYVTCM